MDELAVRLAIVTVAAVGAFVLVRTVGGRDTRPRSVETGDLDPGVYLFTSSACGDCDTARLSLQAALDKRGFDEIRWEDDPETFERLGVGAVPATLVVRPGSSLLYPGSPEAAIRSLNP